MKRTIFYLFCIGSALLITAHRLPAPISEEQPTPTPEVEKLKTATVNRKSIESSDSNSARRFDGTWIRRSSETNAKGTRNDVVGILVIMKGKSAELTEEFTSTLAPGVTWNNLPEPYDTISPLRHKWIRHSSELSVNGSNLTIRWSADQFVDWGPKTVPREHFANMKHQPPGFITYALMGEQLTSNNGKIYRRLK